MYYSTTKTAVLVTKTGKIHRTSDGGSTWAVIEGDDMPAGSFSFNGVSGRNAADISPAARRAAWQVWLAVFGSAMAVALPLLSPPVRC